MAKFAAKIYKLGINPVVDPPQNILMKLFEQAGRSKGPIPVCGKVNGAAFTQTLVKYQGVWRLYINGKMLKDSGLSVGDTAEIDVEFDLKPRTIAMPGELATALQKNPKAKAAYEKLSSSRQKEILRYLGSLKTQETIDKNVDRVMRHLTGQEVDHVLTRPRTTS